MKQIFVYGTLRKGFMNNERFLGKYKLIKKFRIKRLDLYDLGAYPIVVPNNENKKGVVVELYEVDHVLHKIIKKMEEGANYIEIRMHYKGRDAFMYMYPYIPLNAIHIESGDYTKYIKSLK